MSAHEQIRSKIAAFLFNRRADALRSEMYRALCLHVLSEMSEPTSRDEVVDLVAYAISEKVQVTDSFRTIVLDELQVLCDEGFVLCHDDYYELNSDVTDQLPDHSGEIQSHQVISDELRRIAVSLNPVITPKEMESLFQFYMDLANLLVQSQVSFISRGQHLEDMGVDIDSLPDSVSQCKERYKVDAILDADEFTRQALLHPTGLLASYMTRLIQVTVITHLLAWDPELEYLRNRVLSGKTLYIDSSILFALVQTSHPLHYFLHSLLRATCVDLGARLKVKAITLDEYHQAMTGADREQAHSHRELREIAKICKRDGSDPTEYIPSGILADYVKLNLDRIDLGSWNSYKASMTGYHLETLLTELKIEVDNEVTHIPPEQRQDIEEALTRASKIQVERGIRMRPKVDPKHDATMYYAITRDRTKGQDGDFTLGYDMYLLTLDGSLVQFSKLIGLTWIETYFIFPNQWYAMAFPFLRIAANEITRVEQGLTSLVTTSMFPTLTRLIPLELCKYVFDSGGTALPMASIGNVVSALLEERLIESLDPNSQDVQKTEKARLRVERIVAEEAKMHRGIVAEAEEERDAAAEETKQLRTEKQDLQDDIASLKTEKKKLTAQIEEDQKNVERLDNFNARIEAIEADYAEALTERDEKHAAELQARDEALEELNQRLTQTEDSMASIQEQKSQVATQKAARRVIIRKSISIALMMVGLLGSLYVLLDNEISLWIALLAVGLMAVALPLYLGLHRRWALIPYTLGLFIGWGAVFLKRKMDYLLWLIPMAWDTVTWIIDRCLEKAGQPVE